MQPLKRDFSDSHAQSVSISSNKFLMNQIYTLKKEGDSNKKLMGEIFSTFQDKDIHSGGRNVFSLRNQVIEN